MVALIKESIKEIHHVGLKLWSDQVDQLSDIDIQVLIDLKKMK